MSGKIKITIIGSGNIGGATAIGLSSVATVTATARTETTLKRFGNYDICTMTDNQIAVKGADIVVFAVKPWQMEEVVTSLKPYINLDSQIIVSMSPAVPYENFIQWLGSSVKLAYVIPNTAIEVRESMTFVVPMTTSQSETDTLLDLFSHAGKAMEVGADMLLAGTSLASCGIAYALRYISAATKGGVDRVFSEEEASVIVVQTVKGAAVLMDAHGDNAELEIDKVTTPGGLTLRGLSAMEEAGFTESVICGLKAN